MSEGGRDPALSAIRQARAVTPGVPAVLSRRGASGSWPRSRSGSARFGSRSMARNVILWNLFGWKRRDEVPALPALARGAPVLASLRSARQRRLRDRNRRSYGALNFRPATARVTGVGARNTLDNPTGPNPMALFSQAVHRPAWVSWRISYSALIHLAKCYTELLKFHMSR
jgi:hypothetical protein